MLRTRNKKLSRREFLRLAGATAAGLALLPCWPVRGFALADGELDGLRDTGLSLGCTVGEVTPEEAIVWLRAEDESTVQVHYGSEATLKEFASTASTRVTSEKDFTARFTIGGLQSRTTYYYRAAVHGKNPGPICRFVTAPRPDEAATVRFAFSGDSREWYQPFAIMDSVRLIRPDFFVHLGDTIYADRDGIATELPEFWSKYRANRGDLPSQRLLSETSLYVTWDDHEVADNYVAGHPLASIGQRAFFDYWPIRHDPRDSFRLYRSFRWGKAVELFILDTRQYRQPEEKTILGKSQRDWLMQALSSSNAWFKFIATSVPFTASGSDRWGGFPEEKKEILRFIVEKKISGVVFIAADVHYAAVSQVPGGPGLKEIIVGPMAAPVNRLTRGTAKRFEFFSRESFNYGLVTVDAEAKPPHAEVKILDESNRLLYQTRLEAPHT